MPDMYQISTVRMCGCLVLMIVQSCPLVREYSGQAAECGIGEITGVLCLGEWIKDFCRSVVILSALFCPVSLQFILETLSSVPSHYHECALRLMSRLCPAPAARSSFPAELQSLPCGLRMLLRSIQYYPGEKIGCIQDTSEERRDGEHPFLL